jgi:hypothetical protein
MSGPSTAKPATFPRRDNGPEKKGASRELTSHPFRASAQTAGEDQGKVEQVQIAPMGADESEAAGKAFFTADRNRDLWETAKACEAADSESLCVEVCERVRVQTPSECKARGSR